MSKKFYPIFYTKSKALFFISALFSCIVIFTSGALGARLKDPTLMLSSTRIAFSESKGKTLCEQVEDKLIGDLVLSDDILSSLMNHAMQTGLEATASKASDMLKKQCADNTFAQQAALLTKELELTYIVFFREPTPGHFWIEIYGPGLCEKTYQSKQQDHLKPSFWSELENLSQLQPIEFDKFLSITKGLGEYLSKCCAEHIKRNCPLVLFAQELIGSGKAFLFKFNLSKIMGAPNTKSHLAYTFETTP